MTRRSTAALLCFALAGALLAAGAARAEEAKWKRYDEQKGAVFEKRPVEGSSYDELRATLEVDAAPEVVMEAAWKVASDSTSTKDLKKKAIREGPDEAVIYQQLSLPMVSDRDYTVRVWKAGPSADGTQEVRFATANDLGPATAKGHVRLDVVRGTWAATPQPGGRTRVVLITHSDPGGSIPAVFARGAQRDRFALDFWSVVDKLPTKK